MKFEKAPARRKTWPLAVIVAVGLLLGVGIGFFLLRGDSPKAPEAPSLPTDKPLPRMANLPPKEETQVPQAAYPPDAPVLEQARKALREGIDPAGAVAMALSLPESPERADAAFLLLEYAAESGHPEAAFWVGRYYDPTDRSPSGTIQKNAQSAYEWYRKAADGGQQEAPRQIEVLREWIRKKADQGSWEFKQMLKNWG